MAIKCDICGCVDSLGGPKFYSCECGSTACEDHYYVEFPFYVEVERAHAWRYAPRGDKPSAKIVSKTGCSSCLASTIELHNRKMAEFQEATRKWDHAESRAILRSLANRLGGVIVALASIGGAVYVYFSELSGWWYVAPAVFFLVGVVKVFSDENE